MPERETLAEKLQREQREEVQRDHRELFEREAADEYVVSWMLVEIEDFLADQAEL